MESSRQGKYSILSFGVKRSLNQRFRGRSFKKNHHSGEPVQGERKRMQKRKKASKGAVLDEANVDVDRCRQISKGVLGRKEGTP